jgi:hypothetical protein
VEASKRRRLRQQANRPFISKKGLLHTYAIGLFIYRASTRIKRKGDPMVKFAYHCSHEQFSPRELFQYAIKAEQAGFEHLSCSDHFAP